MENIKQSLKGGMSRNEIVRMCMQEDTKLTRSSIISNLARLNSEKLLEVITISEPHAEDFYMLNNDGLMILNAFNNLCNDTPCVCIQKHDPYTIGEEVYKLQAIKNYLYNLSEWVFLSDIINSLDISNRCGSGLPHALTKLEKLGFVIKRKHGSKTMYRIKVKNNVAVNEDITPKNIKEIGLFELIDVYLHREDKWLPENKILDFTFIPRDKIKKILELLHEKGHIYKTEHDGDYIYKSVRTYNPNDNDKSFLEIYIKYLVGTGINERALICLCYGALAEMSRRHSIKREEDEMNYLKEHNFMILEEFEDMRKEILILKKMLKMENEA